MTKAMSAELMILIVLFWVFPLGLFPLVAHDRGQDWRWALLWSFFGGWVGGGFALLLLSKGSRPASAEELEIALITARRKAEEAERLCTIMSGSRKESRLKPAEEKEVYRLDR